MHMQLLTYFLAAAVCMCIEPTFRYISLFTQFLGETISTYGYSKREEINKCAISGVLPACIELVMEHMHDQYLGLLTLALTLLHRTSESPFLSLFPHIPLCASWIYPQLRSADKFIDNCCIYITYLSLFLRHEGLTIGGTGGVSS